MKKAILVGLLLGCLCGGVAHAALLDSFGPQRVQTVMIACDSGVVAPCRVEIVRARSLLPAAQAEADAAGVAVSAVTDTMILRSATRAQINTFLAATSVP